MLTWTCHICKKERPDDKISVMMRPFPGLPLSVAQQNVRYCNDRPACRAGAEQFSFVKSDDKTR